MKTAKSDYAKKVLAIGFLMGSFLIFAHGQKTTLTLKNGKAAAAKYFSPRKKADAHFYRIALRKGQTVEINLDSNSLFLSEENECGVYFELFDGKGKQLFLGDSPAGIDSWDGEIEQTGNYKIKVLMGCLEAFTTADLQKKKPKFKYSLGIQIK